MRKVDENLWMLETDVCGLDNVRVFVMTTEGARMVESFWVRNKKSHLMVVGCDWCFIVV